MSSDSIKVLLVEDDRNDEDLEVYRLAQKLANY